jgi:hypothetical protein
MAGAPGLKLSATLKSKFQRKIPAIAADFEEAVR